jgi:hypothetical protein
LSATENTRPAFAYGVVRLAHGAERFAFTIDGVIVETYRRRVTAERQVEMARFFLTELGHESATAEHLRKRAAARR